MDKLRFNPPTEFGQKLRDGTATIHQDAVNVLIYSALRADDSERVLPEAYFNIRALVQIERLIEEVGRNGSRINAIAYFSEFQRVSNPGILIELLNYIDSQKLENLLTNEHGRLSSAQFGMDFIGGPGDYSSSNMLIPLAALAGQEFDTFVTEAAAGKSSFKAAQRIAVNSGIFAPHVDELYRRLQRLYPQHIDPKDTQSAFGTLIDAGSFYTMTGEDTADKCAGIRLTRMLYSAYGKALTTSEYQTTFIQAVSAPYGTPPRPVVDFDF